jgi:hypothetical protein
MVMVWVPDYSDVILEADRVINACDIPVWIYWMADEKIEINRPSNRPTLAVRSPRAGFAREKEVRPTGVSIHHGHRVVGMQRNYGASAKISIRVRHGRKIARAMAEPEVIIIRGSLIRVQQRNPGRCDDQGERAELSAKT